MRICRNILAPEALSARRVCCCKVVKEPLIHVSEAAKPKAKIREKAQFMSDK